MRALIWSQNLLIGLVIVGCADDQTDSGREGSAQEGLPSTHRARMEALVQSMEKHGYTLNGGDQISKEPKLAILGTRLLVPPRQIPYYRHWKLNAALVEGLAPRGWLIVRSDNESLGPSLIAAFKREWRLHATAAFSEGFVHAVEALVDKAVAVYRDQVGITLPKFVKDRQGDYSIEVIVNDRFKGVSPPSGKTHITLSFTSESPDS